MKDIAFRYPGGKVKVREWLKDHFPKHGIRYGEMFAGRGNVFFYFRQVSDYKEWHLNDPNTGHFFDALRTFTPEQVNGPGEPIANYALMEPFVTFSGAGYNSGGGYNPNPKFYERGRSSVVRTLSDAASLIDDKVHTSSLNWTALDWLESWTMDDFVYIDPPYLDTFCRSYHNIHHPDLLARLHPDRVKTRWALSGYHSDLYLRTLGPPIARKISKAYMSDSPGDNRVEYLWSNYFSVTQ